MDKKMSNLVYHYDKYLNFLVNKNIRKLTKIENESLEFIQNNSLKLFWETFDLNNILQRTINDLISDQTVWSYFDYSDYDKILLMNTIDIEMSNQNYQKLFNKLLNENNFFIDNFNDIESNNSNIDFVPNAYYTISNNTSLEIEISDDGGALRIKDNDFISDWLEIEYKIDDEYGDDEDETIPYVKYGKREIYLNEVFRLK